jgi:hypothetical protein
MHRTWHLDLPDTVRWALRGESKIPSVPLVRRWAAAALLRRAGSLVSLLGNPRLRDRDHERRDDEEQGHATEEET